MTSLDATLGSLQLTDPELGLRVLIILTSSHRDLVDLKTLRLVCTAVKLTADSMVRNVRIFTSHLDIFPAPGRSLLTAVSDLELVCNDALFLLGDDDMPYMSASDYASLSRTIITACSPKLERLSLSLRGGFDAGVWALTSALGTVDWPRLSSIEFNAAKAPDTASFDFLRRMPALTSVCCPDVRSPMLGAMTAALEAVKPNLTSLALGIIARTGRFFTRGHERCGRQPPRRGRGPGGAQDL